MKKQIKLRYSQREKDYIINYPDNAGCLLMGVFFDMLKTTGHRIDWQKNLKDILTEHGYDYKTLKITCDKIKEPQ